MFGVEGNVDVLLGGGGVFVVISSHKVYAYSINYDDMLVLDV